MKNLKYLLTVLISSLFLLNAMHAEVPKPNPKVKLGKEIKTMLDYADWLDLKGECIEANLIIKLDEDNRLVLVNCCTDNDKLKGFISRKLEGKRIWTRNLYQDVNYCLKVRFEPLQ